MFLRKIEVFIRITHYTNMPVYNQVRIAAFEVRPEKYI